MKAGNQKEIEYFNIWLGGNTTSIVVTPNVYNHRKPISQQILNENPIVEQIGFLAEEGNAKYHLRMTGGEFCGNAARSAGFLILSGKFGKKPKTRMTNLQVSGSKAEITMYLSVDKKRLYARIPGDFFIRAEKIEEGVIIHEQGITFLIIPNKRPNKNEAEVLIEKVFNPQGQDAYGVIYIEKRGGQKYQMHPYVSFVQAGERILSPETACASGTIAATIFLTLSNRKEKLTITQPTGVDYLISIVRDSRNQYISFTLGSRIRQIGHKRLKKW